MAIVMKEYRIEYRSYLLKIWRVKDEQGDSWRYSLEDVMTGEKHGFACLEDLQRFLAVCAVPEEQDSA